MHTGDIARRRHDGNLVLCGRRREMFKSGGYNVYPREVEMRLETHPGVETAVVVAVADELYGEVGHAFVTVNDAGVGETTLRAHAWEQLANYKVPKAISVESQPPLPPIGKVDRDELRSRAARRLHGLTTEAP